MKIIKLALTGAMSLALYACSQTNAKTYPPIKIDGSSTVAPITAAILAAYQASPAQSKTTAEITNDISGTSGGFEKFCAGETQISGASRPISPDEMKACDMAAIRFIELPIAFDAITVVVNPNNPIESITTTELKTLWQPSAQGKINNWQQINPQFSDRPLTLYGPGEDSGTFDYFTEVIMGKSGASRTDYVFSEDDEALVNGVAQDPNALGYFGYAYYEQNQDKLKPVAIDSGTGAAVLPSRETVENNQYQPLSRPLFIYVNAKSAQENPALQSLVEFYLKNAGEVVPKVGYIPLQPDGYRLADIQFQKMKVGTVFDGKPRYDLTITDLLKEQAKFEPD